MKQYRIVKKNHRYYAQRLYKDDTYVPIESSFGSSSGFNTIEQAQAEIEEYRRTNDFKVVWESEDERKL